MESLESLGGLLIVSGSSFSSPRARAGKASVIRLMNRRCTGFRSVNPSRVAKNMPKTSLMLELKRN